MAGEQQGHYLVAHLHVGERVAVLVMGVEQQAEDVLAALAARAAAGDLRVDELVELARRRLQPRPGGEWAAEDAQQILAGVVRQRLLEQAGRVDRSGSRTVGVEPEQRAHRNTHGQAAGPVVQIHLRLGCELVKCASYLVEHRLDRGEQMLLVEGREHRAPRAAVKIAVDREQPIAHQADEVAEVALTPEEVGGVRDGDVVVRRRPQHEHHVAVEDPQREDRAEALVGLQKHRQRLRSEAPRAREREARLAGRVRDGRRTLVTQVAEQHSERV